MNRLLVLLTKEVTDHVPMKSLDRPVDLLVHWICSPAYQAQDKITVGVESPVQIPVVHRVSHMSSGTTHLHGIHWCEPLPLPRRQALGVVPADGEDIVIRP